MMHHIENKGPYFKPQPNKEEEGVGPNQGPILRTNDSSGIQQPATWILGFVQESPTAGLGLRLWQRNTQLPLELATDPESNSLPRGLIVSPAYNIRTCGFNIHCPKKELHSSPWINLITRL